MVAKLTKSAKGFPWHSFVVLASFALIVKPFGVAQEATS